MGMSVISANVTQKIVPLFISASFSGTDTLVCGTNTNQYIEIHFLDKDTSGGAGTLKIIHNTLGASYPFWSFSYGGGTAISFSEAQGAFDGTSAAGNATASGTVLAFKRRLILPPETRLVYTGAAAAFRVVGLYIQNSP